MLTLVALIVVLGVLIFVHELGHFLAAKWAGIWVHRFSIGIGNPIPGASFRRGETEYALSWLPIGGYVKMASREEEATSAALEGQAAGETPIAEVPPDRVFEAKPIWKRMIVLLAGVTFNAIFAWLTFTVLAVRNGRAVNPVTTVGHVDTSMVPAGAEMLTTLRVGDRIVSVGGRPVDSWTDIESALQSTSGEVVDIALADGRTLSVPVHPDAVEDRLKLGAVLSPYTAAVVGKVLPNRPAVNAGMQAGDTIVAVDGRPVDQWADVLSVIESSPGRPLALGVGRATGRTTITITPDSTSEPDSTGPRWVGKIGVEVFRGTRFEKYPSVLAAVGAGFQATVDASTTVVRTVRGLLSGRVSRNTVGGPLAIGQMAGEQARRGLDPFLAFMGLMSINLAVLNLLPIPILDGGQFLFLVGEAILGRPLPLKLRERLTLVGLVLIVMLMVFAFWNDIARLLR
jgi:regulator of sigma E protease